MTNESPSRRRWLLTGSLLLVGAVVAALALITTRSGGAAIVDDEPMLASASDPAWIQVMAAAAPDGFDHVAIHASLEEFVSWSIFDIDAPRAILVTVSRGPRGTLDGAVTLETAQAERWTDAGTHRELLLPDGRRVILDCLLVALRVDPEPCPPVSGVATDADELRRLMIALATDVSVDDLPAPDPAPPAIDIDRLRNVADRFVDAEPAGAGDADPASGAAVLELGTYTDDLAPTLTGALTIRAYTGLYPAIDGASERRSVELDGLTTAWQVFADGSLWSLSWSPNLGGDLGDRMLDDIEASSSTR